ncbi:cyanate hydratase [Sphingobium yanoikuyae]|jgi:cyanate lyase|uniref:Cyanate hydratase n=1 Tax=Sphingobium yanoikuyae TaxID=13690 RepID=A0A177JWW8_SPHYA|nr:cyanase [Sphingobium yanoikuyae]OAH45414.1 cyanate hydratase [Sphingobium yanoikuyae]
MHHTHISPEARANLAERVLEAKRNKGLSWDDIAEGTGISTEFVTAALLGQHPLPKDAAIIVIEKLGLPAQDGADLEAIPTRGSRSTLPPTDPTIYRFHEIVQVYGTTLKALIHERFGDGIMSAINFRMNVGREEDPEGGERVVITLNGKFLPTRPF